MENNTKVTFNETKINIKKSKVYSKVTITGIIFLIPSLVLISFSIFIPVVWNFILSFQEWDGYLSKRWVGLNNYIKFFTSKGEVKILWNSLYLGILSTVFAVIIGVMLAVLIYNLGKKEGSVYRLILFMPVMLPLAIIGLLFSFIYNPEMGLINQFLQLIGLGGLKTAWLENPKTVMNCIVVVGSWRMIGLSMMLSFAAMQSIPDSLLESARIDGASYIRQVFSIILPLIKPIVKIAAVFTLVMSFKTYDLVFVMTGGGPGKISKTIPLEMIDTAFRYNEFGYSAAMGFIATIAVMVVIGAVSKIMGGEQYEY